jgi:hypothetical protein
MSTRDKSRYHDVRIEAGGRGLTYSFSEGFTVYGYVTNPRSSVLAGTDSRCYLGHFETIAAAQAEWPSARVAAGSSFDPHAYNPPRPAWCTPAYEAESGEVWEEA